MLVRSDKLDHFEMSKKKKKKEKKYVGILSDLGKLNLKNS